MQGSEKSIMYMARTIYMTLVTHKVKRRGKEYYELVDVKRVGGKVVAKYVGYLGKDPNSKREIEPEDLMPYVQRLLKKGIGVDQVSAILKKLGIEYDVSNLTKITIENDLRLKRIFLRLR